MDMQTLLLMPLLVKIQSSFGNLFKKAGGKQAEGLRPPLWVGAAIAPVRLSTLRGQLFQ